MADSADTCLDLAELDRILQAADPAALLVPPRLLRRAIKYDRNLTGLGARVAHRKSYVIQRDALLQFATRAELGVAVDRELAATLILLAAPDPKDLRTTQRETAILKCWRLLFHARVHSAMAERRLTAAAIRARVQEIGPTEFAEIRTVLRQERYLLPPRDDATVYEEFAALYWELRLFRPALLPRYFSVSEHADRVERILLNDVDAFALFKVTRLAGAPDPDAVLDMLPTQADDATPSSNVEAAPTGLDSAVLNVRAEHDAAKGNGVRAAIRWFQASANATADTDDFRKRSQSELNRLVDRLGQVFGWDAAVADLWRGCLGALLPRAANGFWSPEARLLYDVQKICIDHERPIYSVDLVEWAYSGFRKPLVLPLPTQALVRAAKHLRGAVSRLPALTVDASQRIVLSRLLHDACQDMEGKLRSQWRPVLTDALLGVGLEPHSFPEQVSFAKLIEELLDRIMERGFVNIGDLRDAVSRNEVKLADLTGPVEFVAGDPLIRANRVLADRAAGTYRRGEIYLRGLQRGSSLLFGTRPGRWLTLYLLLPFLGAFATLVFVQEMAHLARVSHLLPWVRIAAVAEPSQDEWSDPVADGETQQHHALAWGPLGIITGGLGVFYLLVLHSAMFRRWLGVGGRLTWSAVRAVTYDYPMALVSWPPLVGFFSSRQVVLIARYGLKPLPAAVLAWIVCRSAGMNPLAAWGVGFAVLAIVSVFVNSRLGRDLEEVVTDWGLSHWEYLRGLVPGLIRLVMDLFHTLLEGIDRCLYEVDEWLRFRHGEGRVILAAKVVLGLGWFLVTYVIRLFVNVLIEPTVNPIKHFPAVTVAAKLLVPFWIPLTELMATPILFLGRPLAYGIAFLVLHALPGAAGFLVWELMENWRLYRANRHARLRPVAIGHHGETMGQLLRPGFHSGTLPKLHAKLRRAERRAHRSGAWQKSRQLHETLHHVEERVAQFVERELLAYLTRCRFWTHGPVHLAEVKCSSNRIGMKLVCPALGAAPLEIHFDEQSGWLSARMAQSGWLPSAAPGSVAVLEVALIGFYKKAGVDVIHEQVQSCFGVVSPPFVLSQAGLVVWPGQGYATEVEYDLGGAAELQPRLVSGESAAWPTLDANRLLFQRMPLEWKEWVAAWDRDPIGAEANVPLVPGLHVLPLAAAGSDAIHQAHA